jgi:hypothetical protein
MKPVRMPGLERRRRRPAKVERRAERRLVRGRRTATRRDGRRPNARQPRPLSGITDRVGSSIVPERPPWHRGRNHRWVISRTRASRATPLGTSCATTLWLIRMLSATLRCAGTGTSRIPCWPPSRDIIGECYRTPWQRTPPAIAHLQDAPSAWLSCAVAATSRRRSRNSEGPGSRRRSKGWSLVPHGD